VEIAHHLLSNVTLKLREFFISRFSEIGHQNTPQLRTLSDFELKIGKSLKSVGGLLFRVCERFCLSPRTPRKRMAGSPPGVCRANWYVRGGRVYTVPEEEEGWEDRGLLLDYSYKSDTASGKQIFTVHCRHEHSQTTVAIRLYYDMWDQQVSFSAHFEKIP